MSFLSLYRKYRPEKFQDLIGQDQIKKTLKNALTNDRVAHAYLFAGPRGTGKTSTAKVFAKALNCAEPLENYEPCGQCNSCQWIEKGNSLDVIEIDAASNRGIDEIRELREKVKFYPGEGQYKVYIIDEVHMLTKGAFNALLKTLEEPPESVVFILATTEPHEVITTIMSRCQRFDFTLLTLSNLKKRLKYIAENEGYQIDNQALDLLARSARGGMRDAISLLDQAISFSDGQLSSEEISDMLGRISKDSLKEFLFYLAKRESQSALELLNDYLESGLGIERFSEELIEYCRELLLIKECGLDSGILEYSRSYLENLAEAASNFSTEEITNIIDEFAALKQKLRSSARPRLQLEISVIKLSTKMQSSSIEARLSELEFKLDNYLTSAQPQSSSDKTLHDEQENEQENDQKDEQKTEAKDELKLDSKAKSSAQKKPAQKDDFESKSKEQKNKAELSAEKPSAVPPKQSQAQSAALSLKEVKENWAGVLNELRQLDVSVQALLREGEPFSVKGKTVIIAFPENKKFHYKGVSSNQGLVEKVLRNILNQAVAVDFQLGLKKKEITEKTDFENEVVKENENKNKLEENFKAEKNSAAKDGGEFIEKSKQSSTKNETKNPELEPKEIKEETDLDIEELADIFSGEIIEVDQTILKDRGGK